MVSVTNAIRKFYSEIQFAITLAFAYVAICNLVLQRFFR
jgi:hypothetical protein